MEKTAEESRGGGPEANTAVVPVPKLEEDSYDWWTRHELVLRTKDAVRPDIVLIGDSLTHFWGGPPEPESRHGSGDAWTALFGGRRVLNLGFGWDRTQNVLWRLDQGQLDGLSPEWIVLNIGTNNTSETVNARANTADEIRDGARAIIERARAKAPSARLVLMAVFPREEAPDHPRRALIREINARYAELAGELGAVFVDIGPELLDADGTLPKEIAFDGCHLTERGYERWAAALRRTFGFEEA
ncbi:Lysophospholipase L1 [Paenibacillus sp. UNC496MF]|uniref:GDSL-type esterase/lipase family protein n=1 Tax=Paenibacillus sp. UNC496MF TaxID=1502753 RepID=UPI0008DEEF5A|nr:GDSL-type esterase/lipase family protein [Paenibacillus sp. UNC496MF]SFJ85995.1 Lysophospholipase L1 [Paenibacillus sp. UNC496MF]